MLFKFNKKSSIQNTCKLDLIKFDPNPFALHVAPSIPSITYLKVNPKSETKKSKKKKKSKGGKKKASFHRGRRAAAPAEPHESSQSGEEPDRSEPRLFVMFLFRGWYGILLTQATKNHVVLPCYMYWKPCLNIKVEWGQWTTLNSLNILNIPKVQDIHHLRASSRSCPIPSLNPHLGCMRCRKMWCTMTTIWPRWRFPATWLGVWLVRMGCTVPGPLKWPWK